MNFWYYRAGAGEGEGAAREWLRITVLVCFSLPSMTDRARDVDDAVLGLFAPFF